MFTITKHWLREFSSGNSRGGWTKAQLEAVGVSWPPPKGWLDAVIGLEIEDSAKADFERLCNREFLMQQRTQDAARHEEMAEMVFYTWPTSDGWTSSLTKPEGWFR